MAVAPKGSSRAGIETVNPLLALDGMGVDQPVARHGGSRVARACREGPNQR